MEYDAYLGKLKDVPKDEILGLLKLTRQEINALQFENPLDVLTDITERSDTLDLKSEGRSRSQKSMGMERKTGNSGSYLRIKSRGKILQTVKKEL